MISARNTATTTAVLLSKIITAKKGIKAPHTNARKLDKAACVGFVSTDADAAFSASLWAETDTYSPIAMESDPAKIPERPTSKSFSDVITPTTLTSMTAMLIIPSLAPSTPARSQFNVDNFILLHSIA